MCPTIQIKDENFHKLQEIAIPLVDTIDSVISRLLESYTQSTVINDGVGKRVQGTPKPRDIARNVSILEFTENNLPDLTHTTFVSGTAGGRSATDWNHLMLVAHGISFERLNRDVKALRTISPANIKSGELFEHGFKSLKGYPFSVQGVETNKACAITLKLARHFNFPVVVDFRWQQKDRAKYPGKTGRLTFDSSITSREEDIRQARKQISDTKLLAFIRSVRNSNTHATRLLNEQLDNGASLDHIFYTGQKEGYCLSIRQTSPMAYSISLGCVAGPCAGDGGDWDVVFDESGAVSKVTGGASWIS